MLSGREWKMGVCGSGLCIIMPCVWKWVEREVAGDCFPGKEARWSLGTMCAFVITAGEVQSWYHRPLGKRSDNGLHSRAKAASAPGARLRSSFLVTMYGMTGGCGCARNTWCYLPRAETEHTQLQSDEAFQKVSNRASKAECLGVQVPHRYEVSSLVSQLWSQDLWQS